MAETDDQYTPPAGLINAMQLPIWGSFHYLEAVEVCEKFKIRSKADFTKLDEGYTNRDPKIVQAINELSGGARLKLKRYFDKVNRLAKALSQLTQPCKSNPYLV